MPIECYSQAAYDKFLNDEKSATLKAHGGTYGGGSETLIVEGIDGYNAATTGNKSSTLGCNCGMSTGRNGVCVFQGQSSHTADISASENIAPTLIQNNEPYGSDTRPTRIKITVSRSIPAESTFKVYVCNNGYDASPTWEDATTSVTGGLVHVFENETKTGAAWGVLIRVEVTRGDGEGACYVSQIGGNFE